MMWLTYFPITSSPQKISTEYHSSILLDYPGPCWRPNGTPQGSVCTVWPGEVRSSWGCEGHPRQIRKPGTGTFGTVCETQGSEGNASELTDPWELKWPEADTLEAGTPEED